MAREMADVTELYRVRAQPNRTRGGGYVFGPTFFGPFSTIGAARAVITRSKRDGYSYLADAEYAIEVAPTTWVPAVVE